MGTPAEPANCSDRCRNQVAMRKYLDDPANQQKRRDDAHETYKRRVSKERGRSVPVERKPRKKPR